jgi:hypothetical protein
MGHHRFFPLTHHDHHTTPYNIYDHRWVPFSHEPDDMQGNFFICMKKPENGSLKKQVVDLVKMMNRGSGTW